MQDAGIDFRSDKQPIGMRFSADGKRIFMLIIRIISEMYTQISLEMAYDTSSFTIDGTVNF